MILRCQQSIKISGVKCSYEELFACNITFKILRMTLLRAASATVIVSVFFALFATVIPGDATATAAPRCILNTIVQEHNDGGTTLSWKVYDAYDVHISGIGNVSDADSVVVYPDTVATYTLTATGKYGIDTCTATVQPTSYYDFNDHYFDHLNTYKCEMSVSPDFVVPGGTGVLSWDAGSADHVVIDHGIGNMANDGSLVIPNNGVVETYSMVAHWNNGTTRHCSATLRPTGAVAAPTYNAGVNVPGHYVGNPNVVTTYRPSAPRYVAINQVPYTGTEEVVYVLGLLAVAVSAGVLAYTQRRRFAHALASLK